MGPLMSVTSTMRVADDIETGRFGKWLVEKQTVTKADEIAQMGNRYRTGRWTPPGTYAGLQRISTYTHRNGEERESQTLVMSDAPDELRDLWEPMSRASHDDVRSVLIHGLGLGCFVKGLVSLPHIQSIQIVEIDAELIEGMPKLAPWLRDPRVSIIEGDAYTKEWPVGSHWDIVWHDIWDDLSTDNLSEGYARLNRRFGSRSIWQGAWGQGFLQYQRERGA